MYHASVAIPGPTDFHVSMHGDGEDRLRTIRIGEVTAGCTVHVAGRAVLGALYDALDEIRADMDAAPHHCDAPCTGGTWMDDGHHGHHDLSWTRAGRLHCSRCNLIDAMKADAIKVAWQAEVATAEAVAP